MIQFELSYYATIPLHLGEHVLLVSYNALIYHTNCLLE